jgi:type I restriction enzyme R subunit
MLGRGSRIHAPTNKLMFRVYDYTNASRLLGEDFVTRNTPTREKPKEPTGEKILVVEGFDVHINPAGTYIITDIDGKLGMATIEEYKEIIASKLSEEVKTFEEFRNYWIDPLRRKALLEFLPNDGAGVRMLRDLMNLKNCDLYDILAEIGFGVAPKSRKERVFALQYKYSDWFNNLPLNTRETLLALARQFEKGGIEELENHYIFEIPEVNKAGGLEALKLLGDPKDVILEVKRMLFTV